MNVLIRLVYILYCIFIFHLVNLTRAEDEAAINDEGENQAATDDTGLNFDNAGEGEAGGAGGNGLDDMSPEQIQEIMKKLDMQGGGNMFGGGGDMFGGGGDMFGGGGGGRRYTRDIPAVEEDVPLIQCQTCQELVKHLRKNIDERKQKKKKTKVTELEILEMLETVCDPLQGDGEWITEFDIVEEEDKLVLVNKGQQGHCEEECKTMVQACDNVVKEADSDIAEILYANKPNAIDRICTGVIKKLKGACGQPAIPIPADRTPGGNNFRPKSEIDIALAEAGKELRKKQEVNPDFLRDDL